MCAPVTLYGPSHVGPSFPYGWVWLASFFLRVYSLPLCMIYPSPFDCSTLLLHSYRQLVERSTARAFIRWGVGFASSPHRCSCPGNASCVVSRSSVLPTTSLLCHKPCWMGFPSCSSLGSSYMTRVLLEALPPNFLWTFLSVFNPIHEFPIGYFYLPISLGVC